MQRDEIIVDYWNGRSNSYSATVRQELENADYQAWRNVLENHLACLDTKEKRCEQIAIQLPFTYLDRPAWDLAALDRLGFESAFADEDIWKTVWPEGDQKFYASSPLFMVNATK